MDDNAVVASESTRWKYFDCVVAGENSLSEDDESLLSSCWLKTTFAQSSILGTTCDDDWPGTVSSMMGINKSGYLDVQSEKIFWRRGGQVEVSQVNEHVMTSMSFTLWWIGIRISIKVVITNADSQWVPEGRVKVEMRCTKRRLPHDEYVGIGLTVGNVSQPKIGVCLAQRCIHVCC